MTIPSRAAADFFNWLDALTNPETVKQMKATIAEWNAMKVEKDEREASLTMRDKALSGREAHVQEVLKGEKSRADALVSQANLIRERELTLESNTRDLDTHGRALANASAVLDHRKTVLDEQEAAIAARDEAQTRQANSLAARANAIAQREQAMSEREKRIRDAVA